MRQTAAVRCPAGISVSFFHALRCMGEDMEKDRLIRFLLLLIVLCEPLCQPLIAFGVEGHIVKDDWAAKAVCGGYIPLQHRRAAAQKNIAAFSENALNSVKTKDLGEVGQALSDLVVELKGFGEEEEEKITLYPDESGIPDLEALKASYAKAEVNVDKIVRALESHQVVLMKDIAMLDQMYELNTKYYKELTMYIIAGKKRLNYLRTNDLEQLKQKAAASGSQEDAQAYNDFANLCNRFEKKIHDLELTRMISVQMGPQTRLLQNNDTLMLEKIQSSLVNTIPLWKSQMVLALAWSTPVRLRPLSPP